jgi:hypothetical protein
VFVASRDPWKEARGVYPSITVIVNNASVAAVQVAYLGIWLLILNRKVRSRCSVEFGGSRVFADFPWAGSAYR